MKNIFFLITIFGVVFLNSCAPVYIPNVVNAPLLSNKNELQVSINTGVSGFDPQIAFAPTDHIGVMLNGSFSHYMNETTNHFHKHLSFDSGIGYFLPFAKHGLFEVYGGMGYARLQADYSNNMWISRTDINSFKWFLQPSIAFKSDVFDGSFTTRLLVVNLFQNHINYWGYFIEPAITAKLGYKNVKFIFQLGVSVPINSDELVFSYEPFLFSVGIQLNLKGFKFN
jgi:hypothetical protein